MAHTQEVQRTYNVRNYQDVTQYLELLIVAYSNVILSHVLSNKIH